ncbi:twin-arginine translocation signal domain-containing protein [Sphingomonas gilva]|uniref:alpha-L-fucosidase n=1 Tax=Sphingomonas gilva TaxID=2305907 RepID=A0A396RQZ6_9SPHN|nr:alpha-L-fucosidase [Sphingomonas gilva]RHW18938.1 twin-arginine translocation signal domain-containing protein [Sphingomonas gilva]
MIGILSRRSLLKGAAALGGALTPALGSARTVKPDWQAFADAYQTPDWFRDAKFGIWSHWGVQCVPEFGDWYGRQMYIQGNRVYEHHLRTYGHPSKAGFIDFIGRWKAEAWDPEGLMALYRKAGARYFMSMANHHDNLDNYDSAHHAWNTVRLGPKRDIVGTWEKIAREAGLRFGVSNHSGHAWHWWQTAYGYDAEGPMKGVRYDAYGLREEHGRGTFWEGLDPQQLYTGPFFVPPDGIDGIAAMDAWHETRDGQWLETPPPGPRGPAYVRKWQLRQMDLVEKYRPDLVYFDNYAIPFGADGLETVAHYYNKSVEWHGAIDVVLTAKRLTPLQRRGIVEDVERGFMSDIQERPWQTCTCIGNWHYDRGLYERHGYKSAKSVVQRLCDIVSKNGNLLLSIPQRGDGSIDADEEAILADLARWFAVNGRAIYATRPWRRFGEGPTKPPEGMQNEGEAKPFVAQDVRFTVGKGVLNAFFLDWPEGESAVASLGGRALDGAVIERVEMQDGRPILFRQDGEALCLKLSPPADGAFVPGVRIMGRGLI